MHVLFPGLPHIIVIVKEFYVSPSRYREAASLNGHCLRPGFANQNWSISFVFDLLLLVSWV